MSDLERGFKWWLRYIIVPLIGGGGGVIAIVVTLISKGCFLLTPIISIVDDVQDEHEARIDKSQAPFKILVRGTTLNARSAFVYLVVDNGNDQYIEPVGSLGANVDGPFSGYCYLGIRKDPASLGKAYTVFAVVTNRKYKEYDLLDKSTVQAKSNELLEPIRRLLCLKSIAYL